MSIVHFEIPVDDLNRAKKFYSQLFGWKLQDMQGMDYAMIDRQCNEFSVK
jgi:hypothetical protein